VLEPNEDAEVWLNLLGYRVFTSLPLLYTYIEKEIEGNKERELEDKIA
jgi:hypothetical protein